MINDYRENGLDACASKNQRWSAIVSKNESNELYRYDLLDNGRAAGACNGFGSKSDANYAAVRMVYRMNRDYPLSN
jgi:hypothetical protein